MNTAAASTGGAGSVVVTILFVIVAIAAYWAPSIVAFIRRDKIPNLGSIIVINIFACLFVPWVIALAMAVRSAVPQHAAARTAR